MDTEIKSVRPGRPAARSQKKKSTSFYLSDDTRDDLRALASEMRLSQASVIETLVRDTAKARGVKSETKTQPGS